MKKLFLAVDGANIWVTSPAANAVTKLRASDGTNLGTFPVGLSPQGIVFDGVNIWLSNRGEDTLIKTTGERWGEPWNLCHGQQSLLNGFQ